MFGDDEKACGVPVQPVDTAVDEILSVLLIMPGEGIGQGVSVVLKRRVDGHVSGLIDHQQVLILINDLKGRGAGMIASLPSAFSRRRTRIRSPAFNATVVKVG